MKHAPYFEETVLGAVVLVALQFLSFPLLIAGLAVLGLAKLASRAGSPKTG